MSGCYGRWRQFPIFGRVCTKVIMTCWRYLYGAGFKWRFGKRYGAHAIQQLDQVDGDLDTLMTRLAYIRTWTYITNRSDWTDTPVEWQNRARFIEDKLSDRLHQRLSERFVDKRAAHLSRKLKETKNLIASVKDDGTVLVEGEEVGQLTGFIFNPTLADGEEKATILRPHVAVFLRKLNGAFRPLWHLQMRLFKLTKRALFGGAKPPLHSLSKETRCICRGQTLRAAICSQLTRPSGCRRALPFSTGISRLFWATDILATPDQASPAPATDAKCQIRRRKLSRWLG